MPSVIFTFIQKLFRKPLPHYSLPLFKTFTEDELTIPDDHVSCISCSANEGPDNTTLTALEYNVTYPQERSPSYFSAYVFQLYSSIDSIPLRLDNKLLSSPQFRTYDHPTWNNVTVIWQIEPYVLNPELLPPPSYEANFHGALFRLTPEFSDRVFGIQVIRQGTSFVFKGYDNPSVRYVVEWCQWKDKQHAYLKVVGMRLPGHPYPYNDPIHPSFILVVPVGLSFVPYPPSLAKFASLSVKPLMCKSRI